MLLRICLALAILAGVGVIAVSQFVLRPQIEGIRETRDTNKREWDKSAQQAKKLGGELKEAKATLETTQKDLEGTKTELASTTAKAADEQKRANGLQQTLDTTKGQLKTAQQDLSAWTALGLGVEQVRSLQSSVSALRDGNEVLKLESGVLHKKITDLTNQIAVLTGDQGVEPPLPAGLKGKVLVVDPKWNFLILDIGQSKDVVPNAVMLVSRNGKLVAKVRIMSVQPERCIANIIPGWKLDDVTEGDMVLALR